MPSDPENVLHRLAVADPVTVHGLVDEFSRSDDPRVLVAAALFATEPSELLHRAAAFARTARDRQAIAIADAYLTGKDDRVDLLARDHLVDHPDSILVAWIADAAHHRTPNPKDQT